MTFTVEARKFCCCLPVRLGVFVLSLLAMVGGAIVAAIGWMSVSQLRGSTLNTVEITDEIALYIHSGIFTLLGLLGMFGFVGSLVKSRGMVVAFSVGLAVHLGLSIGSGVFTIYSIFKDNNQATIATCMAGKTDAQTRQVCQTGMSIVKGVVVAIYVVAWIIELYAYFIVSRYADQLDDEEIAKLAPILPQTVDQQMVYNGYADRFSYSAYGDNRRSYIEPSRPRYEEQGRDRRPRSEYSFSLPQHAYGVSRGKDPRNFA